MIAKSLKILSINQNINPVYLKLETVTFGSELVGTLINNLRHHHQGDNVKLGYYLFEPFIIFRSSSIAFTIKKQNSCFFT